MKLRTVGTVMGISLAGVLGVSVALSGCDALGRGGPQHFDGIPGGGGALGGGNNLPTGQGVGEACSDDEPCRPGLNCGEDGTCEPGMSLSVGEACLIGPECSTGLGCNLPCAKSPLGLCCGPAGEGEAGDACQTDLECSTGLRCTLTGFSSRCAPAGTGDLGAECAVQNDCYQGLFCYEGACGPFVPPYGVPLFSGVKCAEASTTSVEALFHVPGAPNTPEDADFFSLPFPNDIRVTSEGRPDLSGFPTPGPGLLGVDVVAAYVKKVESDTTAFSNNPTITFRFSGALDYDSLDFSDGKRPVVLVDLDDPTGSVESIGVGWSAGSKTNYVCDNWVAVRPSLGTSLVPGHHYAAWVTNDARTAEGDSVARAQAFDAVLSGAAPTDSALKAAHAAYAPLRSYLADRGINPATLVTATVFTVGDPIAPMRALTISVAAASAPTTKDWVKCAQGITSPCSQRGEGRECGQGTADYDEYHALISLPIFQEGEAPYLTEGGNIKSTAVRREDVCMSLTVPKAAAPASGYPLVIFGHGTGGSFRSHVRDDVAGALARSAGQFAVVGIDQVQHGPRRGDSDESPDVLFFNFANPDAGRGNPLQGAADQLTLMRWASSVDMSAGQTGGAAIKLDPAKISLFGHSQGSTHGSLSLPLSGLAGGVLSGNGGSFLHALLTKSKPVDIAGAIPLVVQDAGTDGKLRMGEAHPVLALLQHYIDPADPLHFAPLFGIRPEVGRGPKHLFQTVGIDDTYSPPKTLSAFINAGGLAVAPSGITATGDNQLRPASATPVQGNVTVDMETKTIVARQYQGPGDGHFVVFDVASARDDAVAFLVSLADGTVPVVPKAP